MAKKNNLLKEQNKGVIMIACVCVVAIAVVGIYMLFSNGGNESSVPKGSTIGEDGIVNDIDVIKNK